MEPTPPYDPHMESNIGAAKAYRAELWRHTHAVVRAQRYLAEDKGAAAEETRTDDVVPLQLGPQSLALSRLDGDHPVAPFKEPRSIKVVVQDIDCIYAAEALAARGLEPLLMDAGSRGHFGGGYASGARAQEEELCRRSTLAHQVDTTLGYVNTHLYPLPPSSAIHVPQVKFFRHGADRGYKLMSRPFQCGVGIVAAYRQPALDVSRRYIKGAPAVDTKLMLRNFFRVGARNGYKALVPVAVGCGAFQNPAQHVAEMFAEIVNSPEFQASTVEEVFFAVLDDHNSHKVSAEGNFAPFARVLAERCGALVLRRDGTPISLEDLQARCVKSAGSATSVTSRAFAGWGPSTDDHVASPPETTPAAPVAKHGANRRTRTRPPRPALNGSEADHDGNPHYHVISDSD